MVSHRFRIFYRLKYGHSFTYNIDVFASSKDEAIRQFNDEEDFKRLSGVKNYCVLKRIVQLS